MKLLLSFFQRVCRAVLCARLAFRHISYIHGIYMISRHLCATDMIDTEREKPQIIAHNIEHRVTKAITIKNTEKSEEKTHRHTYR